MLSLFDQGPPPPCPADFNLAAHVLARGETLPDRIALEIVGPETRERWSFARLIAAVRGAGTGLLACGLSPGDAVLLRLGNTVEFPVAFLGAIAAGLVPVPTSAQLTAPEVDRIAAEIRPALIIAGERVALPLAPACPILTGADLTAMSDLPPCDWHRGDAGRPAYMIYTSGTSGQPRAVVHAHRAILARAMMHQGWYGLTGADRLLHAGAFNWTYTLGTGLLDPWTLAATALVPVAGTPAADLGALLARSGTTIFAASPGIYRQMLRTELPALPRLRHALSAGEKMPEALRTAWYAATGTMIFEAFGMSECSTFVSASPARPAPPGTIGFPQTGRRIAVLDAAGNPVPVGATGQLAVARSDPGLFLGYFGAREETEHRFHGEWFLTGDSFQMAADGALSFLGRDDDMMNAGGFRVSPLEVEAAMARFPGLTECAATELRVSATASVIACFYTSAAPLEDAALADHAASCLARYKQPRIFVRVPALPLGSNNKISRRSLRQAWEAEHDPS